MTTVKNNVLAVYPDEQITGFGTCTFDNGSSKLIDMDKIPEVKTNASRF